MGATSSPLRGGTIASHHHAQIDINCRYLHHISPTTQFWLAARWRVAVPSSSLLPRLLLDVASHWRRFCYCTSFRRSAFGSVTGGIEKLYVMAFWVPSNWKTTRIRFLFSFWHSFTLEQYLSRSTRLRQQLSQSTANLEMNMAEEAKEWQRGKEDYMAQQQSALSSLFLFLQPIFLARFYVKFLRAAKLNFRPQHLSHQARLRYAPGEATLRNRSVRSSMARSSATLDSMNFCIALWCDSMWQDFHATTLFFGSVLEWMSSPKSTYFVSQPSITPVELCKAFFLGPDNPMQK